jgi:hypothetical protein
MEDLPHKDYESDYLKLKAANDQLRERGKAWLLETLNLLCAEINRGFTQQAQPSVIQVGRQEWQFKVGNSLMVGERLGVRYRGRTLIIEVGWPREPQHGHVPGQGLARGRVSLSQNTLLAAQAIDELILKRRSNDDAAWYIIEQQMPSEVVTETRLRAYLQTVLAD